MCLFEFIRFLNTGFRKDFFLIYTYRVLIDVLLNSNYDSAMFRGLCHGFVIFNKKHIRDNKNEIELNSLNTFLAIDYVSDQPSNHPFAFDLHCRHFVVADMPSIMHVHF